MGEFTNRTVFITGGSRGIGHAIGLRLAKEGANIAIAAKTTEPHPKLPGTIYTAAEDMDKAGGKGLPLFVDIRDDEAVDNAIAKTVETFGGIDILINNASAISLTGTEQTPMKRYDLMHDINTRGTFMVSQKCIPHLRKGNNPHILNLSPPLNFDSRWFSPHVAYTMAKYGMSLCVLGMAEEFRKDAVAVNALWPRTVIATAAIKNMPGGEAFTDRARTPEVVSDAAYYILKRDGKECTGNYFIDDEVLKEEGVSDLLSYSVNPDVHPLPDFFI
ncbi:MAG: NAD(P)-dependent oxidoreductase [Flavobacteriales bacterium]|nr:NAD(P)-dependent oxidoreductase [Flavobacteriales bacterium]PCH87893.1 MAG: short chain dehydrogenase [Flavobacteriales bacterium]